MLGQFICERGQIYNVIILAGGLGTRMGSASEHIPKALTKIGSQRAIDLLINKFSLVAHKLIIGTGWHADLFESYIKGRYPNQQIAFSRESASELRSNAASLLYALDNADSRYGTIVSFCDLLVLSNPVISGSAMYAATPDTEGVVGTFRHSVVSADGLACEVEAFEQPKAIDGIANGVIGLFVFSDTILLKELVYSLARSNGLSDITTDVVSRYISLDPTKVHEVKALIEFGNEDDLEKARLFWENY